MYKLLLFLIPLIFVISSCNRPVDVIQDDNIPPAVPVGIMVFQAFDGEIGIEWEGNSELDLKGYNIYRRTDSTNYKIVHFTPDNYIIDDSLNYNTTYFYEVTAVDNSDLESTPSNEVSATPINKYKPYKIQNISINARNWEDTISIYLSWAPTGETDIAGYNIYRSINISFTADSTSFLAFTENDNYSDTSNLTLYTTYYYKISAVDKGGLVGDESSEVNDRVLEIPEVIFPQNNSTINSLNNFILMAIKVPAAYEIVVQTNQFFGEIWNKAITTPIANDTLKIQFNPDYIYTNQYYYWRVITFSENNSEPNSISRLYKFIIKQ